MTRLTTSVFSTLRPVATLIPAPTTPAPQAWKKAKVIVTAVASVKTERGKGAAAPGGPAGTKKCRKAPKRQRGMNDRAADARRVAASPRCLKATEMAAYAMAARPTRLAR